LTCQPYVLNTLGGRLGVAKLLLLLLLLLLLGVDV
jgi:hypothetical protein